MQLVGVDRQVQGVQEIPRFIVQRHMHRQVCVEQAASASSFRQVNPIGAVPLLRRVFQVVF